MKWSKKTAQGFSPGKVFQVIALLGRPIGVRCLYQHVVIELQSELILYEQRSQRVIHLAALSGRVLNPGFPRAKALGCSLKPFHGLHAIRTRNGEHVPPGSSFSSLPGDWSRQRDSDGFSICRAPSEK